MNLSRLLIFAVVLVWSSCGKDDPEPEQVCMQADWVGTYTGTAVCDGTSDDATVTITASGMDQIIIEYATSTLTTTFDPLTVEGCDLERTATLGGVTASVSATLDGDDLSLNDMISGAGFDSDCMVTATRQ